MLIRVRTVGMQNIVLKILQKIKASNVPSQRLFTHNYVYRRLDSFNSLIVKLLIVKLQASRNVPFSVLSRWNLAGILSLPRI